MVFQIKKIIKAILLIILNIISKLYIEFGYFSTFKHLIEKIEYQRLKLTKRYKEGTSRLNGRKVFFSDSASYLFIKEELFDKEIYKFECNKTNPLIIDAGANIGLSIIYLKTIYPSAEIIAFEPDPVILNLCKRNIESFGLENVKLHQNALWNEEKVLKFYSEGADGGRIESQGALGDVIEVKTIRLREFLNQKVDFLKIDIEGAETVVLEDCVDKLHNVDKLFIEYHSFTNTKQDLHKILEILVNAGFRYNIQHIGVFSARPLITINYYFGMDLQLNIFAVKL